MRCGFLLVLGFATFTAFAYGFTNDNSVLTVHKGPATHRNLKGSVSTEERAPSVSRLIGFFKSKAAGLNFLKKNPSFATTLDSSPAVVKQVKALYKEPGLVNSLKNSDDLGSIRKAVLENSSGLSKAKLEKIGETAKKSAPSTRGFDDEEGMLLAYGVLAVMLVVILGVGYKMAHS